MAMTIQELREKRKKAWDTARDFLDSKRNANGVLSEEDSKTYDAMEQTIVDLFVLRKAFLVHSSHIHYQLFCS